MVLTWRKYAETHLTNYYLFQSSMGTRTESASAICDIHFLLFFINSLPCSNYIPAIPWVAICVTSQTNVVFDHTILTHWGRGMNICFSSLVQIITCRLFSDKPKPEPIHYRFGSWRIYFTDTLLIFKSFHKTQLEMSSAKWRPFGLDPNISKENITITKASHQ